MGSQSRFIISRKDSEIDDIALDSEGLTIGRALNSDLVLNHRAVSRTHAGIARGVNIPGLADNAQAAERYYLFNLSASNGTLLNGEYVDNVALFDGDVVQIGPYLLKINYAEEALSLSVELELKVQPVEGRTAFLQTDSSTSSGTPDSEQTMLIKLPTVAARGTARLTARLAALQSGKESLTGALATPDQQALDLFWDKRKREAGKIDEKTLLHPRRNQLYGKAQFNWRPTFDLTRLWRNSYFVWATLLTAALSGLAVVAYSEAYAPRPLSRAHQQSASPAALTVRNLAQRPNNNSCTSCHTPAAGMLDRCIECHTTQATATVPAFAPQVFIKGHQDQQLGCLDCHIEHLGPENEAGLLHYGLCYNCHNGTYQLPQAGKSGPAGSPLPLPHGGNVGYPKVKAGGKGDGYWELPLAKWRGVVERWQKKGIRQLQTPEKYSAADSKQQFHDLHLEGSQNINLCVICHFDQRGERDLRSQFALSEAPRQACAKCHAEPEVATGQVRGLAKCSTCHQQHGRTEQQVLLAPEDERLQAEYLLRLGPKSATVATFKLTPTNQALGSANLLRQSLDQPSWRNFGGLPWQLWLALAAALPLGGFLFFAADTLRRKYLPAPALAPEAKAKTNQFQLTESQQRQKDEGPLFPRPVIDPLLCIGCHACVEACPHDVIAITADGVAAPINVDQCMEDTSCQVECPTSPKACVVVHTIKKIPERQVPKRDQQFMTNVPGIYLIGDVSGVPLIKNAINEGDQVVAAIKADLAAEKPSKAFDYDVAIIGMGPAGLSAALSAQHAGLRLLALEQDVVAATIQSTYGKGKFVFYKPDSVETRGQLPLLPDPQKSQGNFKEPMLAAWQAAIAAAKLDIHERESCKAVTPAEGGFRLQTEKGTLKEPASYTARKIILAIGNRGTPMLLKVPGEELKLQRETTSKFCNTCGTPRQGEQKFCVKCGDKLPLVTVEESKVQYKLGDPKDYIGQKCIVVGAGNSAIEVAVALTGFERQGDKIHFHPGAEVTLIIRSDLKGDLKLGNKMNFYDCLDAGRIKAHFRTTIKQIEPTQVSLMDAKTGQVTATLPNDFVFALIGGDKPTTFLEKLGIEILGKPKKAGR